MIRFSSQNINGTAAWALNDAAPSLVSGPSVQDPNSSIDPGVAFPMNETISWGCLYISWFQSQKMDHVTVFEFT